jgi:hypothetical protein
MSVVLFILFILLSSAIFIAVILYVLKKREERKRISENIHFQELQPTTITDVYRKIARDLYVLEKLDGNMEKKKQNHLCSIRKIKNNQLNERGILVV